MLRIACPREVDDIADVPAKRTRMTPLNCLFDATKLNGGHFQCPDNYHLVVRPARQVLAIGCKPDNIDSSSMSLLKIVLVHNLPFFKCAAKTAAAGILLTCC